MEKDNENQVMVKEEWLEVRAMEQLCYDTRVWTDFGLGLGLGP